MEEVTKTAFGGTQTGPVGRQAVDHRTLGLEILDDRLDLSEMAVDLELLRRLVPQVHQALLDGRREIDADALGIADDLGRWLVQGDHEAALATPGPFRDEL